MVCKKCGTELPEHASCCNKCGTERDNIQKPLAENAVMGSGRKPDEKGLPVSALILAAIIIGILVIGIIFSLKLRSKRMEEDIAGADGTADYFIDETNGSTEDEIPLYNIQDADVINLYAINRNPGEKVPGMEWDPSLFYWLEDVSQESSEDGYLASCRIWKTLLRSSESGEIIQCEVYCDPTTAEIYKIVSIEEKGDSLLLTDYYYQNGIPNFVFVRQDSVYTPTYATTDKTGERYYFAMDVMVQWRIIQTPREIEEYILSPSAVSYRQYDYFQEEESVRSMYDDVELRMLNAAYNIYHVVASKTGIGLMEGMVKDTSGAGIGGVTVDIRRQADNVLLYRTVTGEEGIFRCFVYLDDTECFLAVRGNETFQDAATYGILLADSGITGMYGVLVLNKSAGEEYPVHINIYMADEVRSGEDGNLKRTPVYDATVSFRKGKGACEGEIFRTLQVGEGDSLDIALPSGTYTAQIDVPGCVRTFLEIRVVEGENNADSYVLPELAQDFSAVVLTWEGEEVDLDLTLFTPFHSTEGDMAHIGGGVSEDEYGNCLVSDNSSGCEVIYVNTAQTGSYKIYVSDYTDSQTENYSAEMLGKINIHIYIYDSNGLVRANWKYEDGRSWACSWEEYIYDDLEKLAKHLYYNSDGTIGQWVEYRYDSDGKLIKETEYGADQSVISEKNYDNRGNEIRYESFDPMNNFIVETDYDSQGKEIKCTYYYNNGMEIVVDYWTEKSYDSLGREVKSIRHDGWLTDGSATSWTEMSYDSWGNRIKELDYDSDGSVRSWMEMSYDSQGNMIKSVKYDSDGSVRSWTEKSYGSQGNKTKDFSYMADGSVLEGYEYTYDDRGNLIRSARSSWLGLSDCTEYSYDSQGYLIEMVGYLYENGSASREWSCEYLYE